MNDGGSEKVNERCFQGIACSLRVRRLAHLSERSQLRDPPLESDADEDVSEHIFMLMVQ